MREIHLLLQGKPVPVRYDVEVYGPGEADYWVQEIQIGNDWFWCDEVLRPDMLDELQAQLAPTIQLQSDPYQEAA